MADRVGDRFPDGQLDVGAVLLGQGRIHHLGEDEPAGSGAGLRDGGQDVSGDFPLTHAGVRAALPALLEALVGHAEASRQVREVKQFA